MTFDGNAQCFEGAPRGAPSSFSGPRSAGGLRLAREQAVTVDDGRREVDEVAVVDARPLAQQLERAGFVDGVALHEDALRALGHGSAAERAFEIVILAEATQDDV